MLQLYYVQLCEIVWLAWLVKPLTSVTSIEIAKKHAIRMDTGQNTQKHCGLDQTVVDINNVSGRITIEQ